MPWHTMPKQGLSCVLFICWITLAHCTTCVYKSYCDPGCTGYPSCTGYNSNYGATNCYYCKPCGIGQFKPWDARRPDRTSNDQCYYCGTNLFTFFEGSTKESDCVCGPGVAPYGVPYYYGISWEIFCYRCGYGTYKDEIGMTPCKSCPAGKYAGGTMNTQCTLCPANTYSTTVAARYSTSCLNCPQFSTSAAGSSTCNCSSGYQKVGTDPFTCEVPTCAAGSTGPPDSCAQCAPGKYKAASGSAPCDDCVPGKYSAATGASTAATCLSCSAGSYAGTPGSFACSLCPSGKYSNATAASTSTTCQDCLAGKYSAATGASTAATCQNCAAGSYAATQASSACSLCPSSTYSAVTGVTTCQNCEQGKYSPAGSSSHTQCNLCAAGYGYIHDPNKGRQYCFPCLRGFYKPYADNSACLYCPCNLYGCSSTLNEGSISQADCMCAPNSVGINGQQGCSVCPAGKFKSGYGNGVCETTGRSCVNPCGQGNFKNNDVCTVCPANTYKYWGGDCEPCIPCWNGTYVGGAGTAPGECSPPECPTGKETIAASGQKYCLTCGVNQWSERGNSCQDCPVNSYSATGGTGLAGCICNEFYKQDNTGEITASSYFACRAAPCPAGTTGTSPACTLCTIGTYKSIEGTSACLPCPANTFSNVSRTVTCAQCPPFSGTNGGTGKTAQTDCVCTNTGPAGGPCEPVLCAAGWTGPAGSCVACLGGTYKNTVGSEACALCPLNSSSPSGSSALTACQCNAGFSGANGGTCSACVAGSYKATVGSVACTLCGANTYSTSNASISATSCLACPGNTTSVAGSSVCQCKS